MFFNSRLALLRGARTLNFGLTRPVVQPMARSIMTLPAVRTLMTTAPKQAGYSNLRTSMLQGIGDAWHAHAELKIMYLMLVAVLFLNFMTWVHASGDPRYYFGADQKNNRWKKYMTEKQWCQTSGLGLSALEFCGNSLLFDGDHPGYDSKLTDGAHFGWKQAWRRDLFRLIVEIETYKPKGSPWHPLPLGGDGHPSNVDSPLTKLLKFEGKPLMYNPDIDKH